MADLGTFRQDTSENELGAEPRCSHQWLLRVGVDDNFGGSEIIFTQTVTTLRNYEDGLVGLRWIVSRSYSLVQSGVEDGS
jgi:hypothetical protein